MGSAGRDFHDYMTFFRQRPEFRVCAFTAVYIAEMDGSAADAARADSETAAYVLPKELAGADYEGDIPIYPESKLEHVIRIHNADFVFWAGSDIGYEAVMQRAVRAQAAGASFALLGPKHTALASEHPVIAVMASRTGAGHSPLARMLTGHLVTRGRKVGVIHHPMLYGDLARRPVRRLATFADLIEHRCTAEEREAYHPYLERDLVVYAGVDYASVLAAAERESDLLFWEGSNGDLPFVQPDLSVVVIDAQRAADELRRYPSESNVRRADVIVLSRVSETSADRVAELRQQCADYQPHAEILEADMRIDLAPRQVVEGRRVLVVEDGNALVAGGPAIGTAAAERFAAAQVLDVRAHAVGTVAEVLAAHPSWQGVLPVMGYSAAECRDIAATIAAAAPEAVIDAAPARLSELTHHGYGGRSALHPNVTGEAAIEAPIARVRLAFAQKRGRALRTIVDEFLERAR